MIKTIQHFETLFNTVQDCYKFQNILTIFELNMELWKFIFLLSFVFIKHFDFRFWFENLIQNWQRITLCDQND